jgi:N-acetylmuramoyl-L-alanine amidase-like protein
MRAPVLVLAAMAAAAGCGGGGDKPAARTATAGGNASVPDAVATPPPQQATQPPPRPSSAPPSSAVAKGAPRPDIVDRPIPFPASRKAEMAAYAERHYGLHTYRLTSPHVIVEHYTATQSFQATYDIFAPDKADPELHELPNVCSHFVIDSDGTIYRLVPLSIMCRHTVGLNYTAIGIEHVGNSDAQVLGDKAQLDASLKLTRWLRCSRGIALKDVIGHNESLSSPYHQERVARLRTQTHQDFRRASMDEYRAKLARLPCG